MLKGRKKQLIIENNNILIRKFKYEDLIMHYAPFIVFFSIVALVIGIGVWWFENYYGKYINQIENILNELK